MERELLELKKKALERGAEHVPARNLELTPGQLEVLQQLGYGGEEGQ